MPFPELEELTGAVVDLGERLGEPPLPSPLILGKKKKRIAKGRKASRASDKKPPPPPLLSSGSGRYTYGEEFLLEFPVLNGQNF